MTFSNTSPQPGQDLTAKPRRIASIDWMRGIVMILMMIDHVDMAFNGNHFSADSAAFFSADTVVTNAQFITRWISHLCAPTFVFLAGTALAISIERRVAKGQNGWDIDKRILIRGLFILLLDPTLVSFFSWRFTFQVLYAIGLSMMLMTILRRLPTIWLLAVPLIWIFGGEWITGLVWNPEQPVGNIPVALTMAIYYTKQFRIMYPLLPWLAMMCLGWVLGRYLNDYLSGKAKLSPQTVLLLSGLLGISLFVVVRTLNGYGNMFIPRYDDSWLQFFMMSKYPPSLAFTAAQLGLLCVILAILIMIEPLIGVRNNGPMLVFGQTAMFYYLIHRVVLEGLAQWGGLRGQWGLRETYIISVVFVIILYPMCLWYRKYKKNHPTGWAQFV